MEMGLLGKHFKGNYGVKLELILSCLPQLAMQL